jgi:hypothetical protein
MDERRRRMQPTCIESPLNGSQTFGFIECSSRVTIPAAHSLSQNVSVRETMHTSDGGHLVLPTNVSIFLTIQPEEKNEGKEDSVRISETPLVRRLFRYRRVIKKHNINATISFDA